MPTVRRACRRVLGDDHATDDAFQATFLVLARKAGRIGEDVALGGWLHRVAVRVATRARRSARRMTAIDGIEPAAPDVSPSPAERAELLEAIDAEIARLPARYRAAVVLCHVEGLNGQAAARRLRLPLGTLQSRLYRARLRLRRGLIRRGLAPAALAFGLGEARAGGIPSLLGRLIVKKAAWIACTAIAVVGVGGGAGLAYRGGDEPRAKAAVRPTVAERIRAVMDEFHHAEAKTEGADLLAIVTGEKWAAIHRRYQANSVDASRKLLALIDENPADPAALKAMLWHVNQYWTSGTSGLLYDQLVCSVDVLLRHYVDQPRVAWRVLVRPSTLPSRLDDRLTPGLAARARNREAKGFALLALGEYLEEKANMVLLLQQRPGRFHLTYREGAKSKAPLYDEAYETELRACDAAALRAQAEAALARVVAEFGDVVKYGKDPVDENFNTWVESRPIGDEAAERLAVLRGVAIGKPAPDFSWTRDGKTSRLSDFRGKVVVLSFRRLGDNTSSRDGTSLARIASWMKDRPVFVMGVQPDGAIAQQFGIRRAPSTVVIDAAGILRFQCGWSPLVGDYVERLVAETEAKP